jgi:hypothetical protein
MQFVSGGLQQIIDTFTGEGLGDPMGTFNDVWSGVRLNRIRRYHGTARAIARSRNRIDFYNTTFQETTLQPDGSITHPMRNADNVHRTVAHELAHVWDRRAGRDLSEGLKNVVGGQYQHSFIFFHWGEYTVNDFSPYRRGLENPPSHGEDWAYTFAAFVVDPNGLGNLNASNDLRSPYISQQLQMLQR